MARYRPSVAKWGQSEGKPLFLGAWPHAPFVETPLPVAKAVVDNRSVSSGLSIHGGWKISARRKRCTFCRLFFEVYTYPFITSPSVVGRSIAFSVSVCLFVSPPASSLLSIGFHLYLLLLLMFCVCALIFLHADSVPAPESSK